MFSFTLSPSLFPYKRSTEDGGIEMQILASSSMVDPMSRASIETNNNNNSNVNNNGSNNNNINNNNSNELSQANSAISIDYPEQVTSTIGE